MNWIHVERSADSQPSKEIINMKFLICVLVTALCGAVAAAEYADGKIGKALILGGNSQTVKIPHYAGLKPAKAITIPAWIKPERAGKGGLVAAARENRIRARLAGEALSPLAALAVRPGTR